MKRGLWCAGAALVWLVACDAEGGEAPEDEIPVDASGDGEGADEGPDTPSCEGEACCAPGEGWVEAEAACVALGVDCEDPESCALRWCETWEDADGAPCAPDDPEAHTCGLVATACSEAEGGCPIGQWRGPAGECQAAGWTGEALADETPKYCWAAEDGLALRRCQASELAEACVAGTWRRDGECVPAGTHLAWKQGDALSYCPGAPCEAGYGCVPGGAACTLAQLEAGEGLPAGLGACEAATVAGAVAVAAGESLAEALAGAPSGATILLAEGTWSEALELSQPVQLLGACAGATVLAGGLTVSAAGVELRDLSVGAATIEGELVGHGVRIADTWTIEGDVTLTASALDAEIAVAGGTLALVGVVASGAGERPGIEVSGGGSLDVRASVFTGHWERAIAATGAGTRITGLDVRIEATSAPPEERERGEDPPELPLHGGLAVDEGAGAWLEGVETYELGTRGVASRRPGEVALVGWAHEGPGAQPEGDAFGWGHVGEGALLLVGSHLRDAWGTGIAVADGPEMAIAGTVIEGSRFRQGGQEFQDFGAGVLGLFERFSMVGSRVTDNVAWGVALRWGQNWLADTLVDRNEGVAFSKGGNGIRLDGSGTSLIEGCRLHRNTFAGLYLDDAYVALRDTVIDDTQPVPLTQETAATGITYGGNRAVVDMLGGRLSGHALGLIGFEGVARLRGVELSGNQWTGVIVQDTMGDEDPKGTAAHLVGTVVEKQVGLNGAYGLGAFTINPGNLLQLAGSVVRENHFAGVMGMEQARARVVGSLIEGQLPDETLESYGVGAAAILDGHVDVVASLLRGNAVAGMAIVQGSGTLESSVVSQTEPTIYLDPESGDEVDLADGVLALDAISLEIRDCTLADNPRAGLLVDQTPDIVIERTLVADNAFGVVVQAGSSLVEDLLGFVGNGRDRCKDALCLQVPSPPEFAPPSVSP